MLGPAATECLRGISKAKFINSSIRAHPLGRARPRAGRVREGADIREGAAIRAPDRRLQWRLADMANALNAARLSLHQAALSADPFPDPLLATQAKIIASEAANNVTNQALQLFGARGYSRDYPLERMVLDARMFTIAAGTAQDDEDAGRLEDS
ncbi:acyl-CoA dehydrogenase family protein [Bradyrhizobium sp. CCBAU 051011]|uniref:acyl-CoA dehydrogenase family protein n=1 Tax=Bradyrhizobium sp. CCBAU 051011 TaxID=858422 RepID=UPI00352A463E